MSEVRFSCHKCNAKVKAPASAVGGRGKCPSCKSINIIPSPDDQLIKEVSQLLHANKEKDEKL